MIVPKTQWNLDPGYTFGPVVTTWVQIVGEVAPSRWKLRAARRMAIGVRIGRPSRAPQLTPAPCGHVPEIHRAARGEMLSRLQLQFVPDVEAADRDHEWIGGGRTFVLARSLASLLFEVKPSDFGSVALPLASLLLASAAAAIPPAMRAAKVDPMEALRYE